MKPSIGRIVHYVARGTPGGEPAGAHRAAIITAVYAGAVSLCVLTPMGMQFVHDSVQDERTSDHARERRAGSWHWPEREV